MYKIKQICEDFIVDEIYDISDLMEDGKFFYYKLTKKGMNTIDAVNILREKSGADINYAGNKDKNAVTSQTISSDRKINESEDGRIKTEFLGRKNSRIHLGANSGNSFIVTIRNLDIHEAEHVKNKLAKNKNRSFINYYGSQRFGRNNLKTAESILKRDFKTATELIDHKNLKKYLNKHPTDYIGAIKTLPKKLLNLIINSYQSNLWNLCAKEFSAGNIPIAGFATEFENKEIEKFVLEQLKKDNLSLRSFIMREFPNINTEGGARKRISAAKNIDFMEKDDDELNKGMKKIKISFALEKGSFATVFIEQLFE